jgi:hypothetical protein
LIITNHNFEAPGTQWRIYQSHHRCLFWAPGSPPDPWHREVRWAECPPVAVARVSFIQHDSSRKVNSKSLRGPAPIVHTLLAKRNWTGVTVQTLHPKHFDQGIILAQTPSPGFPVDLASVSQTDLAREIAPVGAEMLVRTLRDGLFVPPVRALPTYVETELARHNAQLKHAPKITAEDRHIQWTLNANEQLSSSGVNSWTVDEIMLRDRALGNLWDMTTYSQCHGQRPHKSQRVIFHGWRLPDQGATVEFPQHPGVQYTLDNPEPWKKLGLGCPCWIHEPKSHQKGPVLGLLASEAQSSDYEKSRIICPTSATIEGHSKGNGIPKLLSLMVDSHRC